MPCVYHFGVLSMGYVSFWRFFYGICIIMALFHKKERPPVWRSSLFAYQEGDSNGSGVRKRAGGIAALRRRGRRKQGRNFRSRAASRAEPLRRGSGTASAARWKAEPRPGLPRRAGRIPPCPPKKDCYLNKIAILFSCRY